jgi:hypothetical protein
MAITELAGIRVALKRGFSSGACNDVSKPDQGLSPVLGILNHIRRRLPASRLAKNNDRRSAKLEYGLFVASRERGVQWMHLFDTTDRHGADFNEGKLTKVPRLEDVNVTVIAKKYVLLML